MSSRQRTGELYRPETLCPRRSSSRGPGCGAARRARRGAGRTRDRFGEPATSGTVRSRTASALMSSGHEGRHRADLREPRGAGDGNRTRAASSPGRAGLGPRGTTSVGVRRAAQFLTLVDRPHRTLMAQLRYLILDNDTAPACRSWHPRRLPARGGARGAVLPVSAGRPTASQSGRIQAPSKAGCLWPVDPEVDEPAVAGHVWSQPSA
jgi:hypothetical protein